MNMSLNFCDNIPLSLAGMVVAVLLAFVLGGKLKLNLFGHTLEFDFSELRDHMRKAGLQPAAGVSTTTFRAVETERLDLSARECILESWGSLKQIVYDLALVRHVSLTPATKTPEAVDRLLNGHVIDKDLAQTILLFYNEGKRIADQPDARVNRKSAAFFQECIYNLLDWLMCNTFTPPPIQEPTPVPTRLTEVGGSFPQPVRGLASAALRGVAGAIKGREFAVDKERIRIGSDSTNEVCISGDAYVSGQHAEIRYDRGCLWLTDRQSKNGTFVNDRRLKEKPVPLNFGDRILVGTSTLEVTRGSAH